MNPSAANTSISDDPQRQSPPPPSTSRRLRSGSPDTAQVPVFKIVALGNQRSGKTVLLTAAAHHLKFFGNSRRFRLLIDDPATAAELGARYQAIATKGVWPDKTSTADFTTYRFKVEVASPTGPPHDHLFDIEWIDYGGELIDNANPGSHTDDQFQSYIRDANVVFCLLDGARLRAWIEGSPDGAKYVHHDIAKIIEVAQGVRGSVHVLITKWDVFDQHEHHLFPGSGGQLEMLRAALMNVHGFSDLRTGSTVGETKRLIPVSAVGRGFVRIDEDGAQHIVPNAHPHGINLDVPFDAVVLDFLQCAAEQLTAGDRRLLRIPGLLRFPRVLDRLMSSTAATLLRQVSIENVIFAATLELLREVLRPTPTNPATPTEPAHRLVTDMKQVLHSFEDTHPASVLGLPAWAHRA